MKEDNRRLHPIQGKCYGSRCPGYITLEERRNLD